jgi:hypothetical protein
MSPSTLRFDLNHEAGIARLRRRPLASSGPLALLYYRDSTVRHAEVKRDDGPGRSRSDPPPLSCRRSRARKAGSRGRQRAAAFGTRVVAVARDRGGQRAPAWGAHTPWIRASRVPAPPCGS